MNEINLPPNADQIHPDDCTCGVAGCTEHQSWGDWLLDQIFGPVAESPALDTLLNSLSNADKKSVAEIALEHGVSAQKAAELDAKSTLNVELDRLLASLDESEAKVIRERFGLPESND